MWPQIVPPTAAVCKPGYFDCEICGNPLLFVGQFSAGFGGAAKRTLYIFGCGRDCSADSRAWRALRCTGPVSPDLDVGDSADVSEDKGEPEGGLSDWADDDWGMAAADSVQVESTVDARIDELLQLRDDALAKGAEDASQMVWSDDVDVGESGWEDDWKGIPESFGCQTLPSFVVKTWPEPPPPVVSGEHEQELLDTYMRSDLANDNALAEPPLAPNLQEMLQAEVDSLQSDTAKDTDEFDEDNDDMDDLGTHWLVKFQKRLAWSPSQVVRYEWNGCPLWLAPPPTRTGMDAWPPSCGRCGSARIFELQLLPTLAHKLHSICPKDDVIASLGWGNIIVYTCGKDCRCDDPCEEFVVVQPTM